MRHMSISRNITTTLSKCIDSLWPGDPIWRHRSGLTLVQVMTWCLTAPSHYLNQCWIFISEVLRQFYRKCSGYLLSLIRVWNYQFKLKTASPRDQWELNQGPFPPFQQHYIQHFFTSQQVRLKGVAMAHVNNIFKFNLKWRIQHVPKKYT